MGNRLSGLWCKKTTTLNINNISDQTKQQQQETQISNDQNKSHRRKSGGTFGGGTFRLGSARRLSLTSCVSKDNNKNKTTTNKSTNSVSTIEQQYEELVNSPVSVTATNSNQFASKTLPNLKSKTTMKVNAQLPSCPTVKVSSQSTTIRNYSVSTRSSGFSTSFWGRYLYLYLHFQFVSLNVIICGIYSILMCQKQQLKQ